MHTHPDLEPIRFLIGSWRGAGRGQYPTVDPFAYTEEVSYRPGPEKPFLIYTQATRSADGAPLHAEVGYLRIASRGPELVIAQPTGLTEVHVGNLAGTGLEFRSVTVSATPTAKPVGQVVRRLSVSEDELTYTLDMAYRDIPLELHLEARLQRMTES